MNLHTTDLPLVINREFYDDLVDNFTQIEENFQKIQDACNDFQNQIDTVSDRLDKLDTEKATHDDVNDLRKEMYQIRDDWHDRASHIARGTDIETTQAVVEQILQEKGLI